MFKALYEAFMGTWRTSWHSTILPITLKRSNHRFSRTVIDALFKALKEQMKICLASPPPPSVCSDFRPLTSRPWVHDQPSRTVWPHPWSGREGLLLDGVFQQDAEKADKGEEQLKKARTYASKRSSSAKLQTHGALELFFIPLPLGLRWCQYISK